MFVLRSFQAGVNITLVDFEGKVILCWVENPTLPETIYALGLATQATLALFYGSARFYRLPVCVGH